jgi:hypothetical protein
MVHEASMHDWLQRGYVPGYPNSGIERADIPTEPSAVSCIQVWLGSLHIAHQDEVFEKKREICGRLLQLDHFILKSLEQRCFG